MQRSIRVLLLPAALATFALGLGPGAVLGDNPGVGQVLCRPTT